MSICQRHPQEASIPSLFDNKVFARSWRNKRQEVEVWQSVRHPVIHRGFNAIPGRQRLDRVLLPAETCRGVCKILDLRNKRREVEMQIRGEISDLRNKRREVEMLGRSHLCRRLDGSSPAVTCVDDQPSCKVASPRV